MSLDLHSVQTSTQGARDVQRVSSFPRVTVHISGFSDLHFLSVSEYFKFFFSQLLCGQTGLHTLKSMSPFPSGSRDQQLSCLRSPLIEVPVLAWPWGKGSPEGLLWQGAEPTSLAAWVDTCLESRGQDAGGAAGEGTRVGVTPPLSEPCLCHHFYIHSF